MPVGSSNALKSKTLNPRGARTKLGHPAPNLDRATTTTATVSRVRSGGVSRSQSPSNPREVSLQVNCKISFEEKKQRRPRERERDEVQGTERKVREVWDHTTAEQTCEERAKEKSLILTAPKYDLGCKVQGRRKRVVESRKFSGTIEKEQTELSKLQERQVPDGERSKQAERLRGRRKRVLVSPLVRRPTATVADQIRLEKLISDLYDDKCALKMDDISKKAEFIKTVVEKEIIMKIRELDDRFTFDILRAGSYYEKLKVGKPNEFDIMVCLKGNDVDKCFEVQVCPIRRATPHLGGFAYLQYQGHKDKSKCWEDLLISSPRGVGLVLSSHLIVSLFRNLISRRCQKLSQNSKGNVQIEEPTIKGPAVNVRFTCRREVVNVDIVLSIGMPTWPANANRWGAEYRRWPSRKMIDVIRSKGCHVVPKSTNMNPRYWRLSFSLAEKSLLRVQAIDGDKKCYRIIKHIYEINRIPLEPLCSYFLKTLFLHLRTSAFFKHGRQISIITKFFEELISKIEEKKLQHFFIPDVNLLCDLTDAEARQIVLSLRKILSNFSNIKAAITFFKYLLRRTCEV